MAQEEIEEDFSGRLLHQAALWGNAELLEDLLHGEMLEFLNAKDSHGRTALHAASTNENETCTRILLQAGADPNTACGPKEQNKTALHIAAESGHLAIARLLLEHDADILAKDSSGLTAMDIAEKADHPHVMELLKETANDREQHREELHLALWEACSKGDASKAKQLIKKLGRETELIINSTPNGCSTLLFKACEEGQKEIVKLLLDNAADGRIHPITKYSPLYIACYYGRKEIVDILIKKFPELVVVTTVEKWLPMHAAVINGHLAVLDLLLKFPYDSSILQKFMDKTQQWEYWFPFDINAKDVTEQTVLYVACLVGNQRIVDLLLKFKVPAKKVKKENDEQDRKDEKQKYEYNVSPTRKRLSTGIQSMISKLSSKHNGEKEEERTDTDISPLNLDLYCNNNTETALHIAV